MLGWAQIDKDQRSAVYSVGIEQSLCCSVEDTMVWTSFSIGISEKRVLSGLRKNPKDAVQTIFLLFGGIVKQQFSRKLILH